MFRVKICGVTSVEDAAAAKRAGADAIGLNFYERSPRFVTVDHAEEISAGATDLARVGVFVNMPADAIVGCVASASLTAVQLHGDEPPELAVELLSSLPRGVEVLRAFRRKDGDLSSVVDYLAEVSRLGGMLKTVLIDAYVPGHYGGAGARADWRNLAGWRERLPPLRLILAGGLDPTNVAEAIGIVWPSGVDVASGIELSPGKKDSGAMRQFAQEAQRAFDLL